MTILKLGMASYSAPRMVVDTRQQLNEEASRLSCGRWSRLQPTRAHWSLLVWMRSSTRQQSWSQADEIKRLDALPGTCRFLRTRSKARGEMVVVACLVGRQLRFHGGRPPR
ncbi:hypothetical protein SETIT_1G010600v2, partial [Setaria italica]